MARWGNKNAQKGGTVAAAHLHIRVHAGEKARWALQAKSLKLSLARWVRMILNMNTNAN